MNPTAAVPFPNSVDWLLKVLTNSVTSAYVLLSNKSELAGTGNLSLERTRFQPRGVGKTGKVFSDRLRRQARERAADRDTSEIWAATAEREPQSSPTGCLTHSIQNILGFNSPAACGNSCSGRSNNMTVRIHLPTTFAVFMGGVADIFGFAKDIAIAQQFFWAWLLFN